MSKINAGVLGGFSGKVGNCIGFNRNGKSLILSLPIKKDSYSSVNIISFKSKTRLWNDKLDRCEFATKTALKQIPLSLIFKRQSFQSSVFNNSTLSDTSKLFNYVPCVYNSIWDNILFTSVNEPPKGIRMTAAGIKRVSIKVGSVSAYRWSFHEYNQFFQFTLSNNLVWGIDRINQQGASPAGKIYLVGLTLFVPSTGEVGKTNISYREAF